VEQTQGAGAFGKASSMADDCADGQTRTIFYPHMAATAQHS